MGVTGVPEYLAADEDELRRVASETISQSFTGLGTPASPFSNLGGPSPATKEDVELAKAQTDYWTRQQLLNAPPPGARGTYGEGYPGTYGIPYGTPPTIPVPGTRTTPAEFYRNAGAYPPEWVLGESYPGTYGIPYGTPPTTSGRYIPPPGVGRQPGGPLFPGAEWLIPPHKIPGVSTPDYGPYGIRYKMEGGEWKTYTPGSINPNVGVAFGVPLPTQGAATTPTEEKPREWQIPPEYQAKMDQLMKIITAPVPETQYYGQTGVGAPPLGGYQGVTAAQRNAAVQALRGMETLVTEMNKYYGGMYEKPGEAAFRKAGADLSTAQAEYYRGSKRYQPMGAAGMFDTETGKVIGAPGLTTAQTNLIKEVYKEAMQPDEATGKPREGWQRNAQEVINDLAEKGTIPRDYYRRLPPTFDQWVKQPANQKIPEKHRREVYEDYLRWWNTQVGK